MSSSSGSGVLTLLHTACGAGILAMPYAFKPYGLVAGFGMILFCGICSCGGLLLQSQVSKYAPPRHASFFALAQLTYPQLSVVFDLAIAIKCFGVGVSYMVVAGDVLPQIFSTFTHHPLLLNRNFHVTLVMACVVAPLCFMRRLNSLRYASMVAISAVAYLCVLVVVHFLVPSQELRDLKGDVTIWKPTGPFAQAMSCLPIYVFAYTCHHNMFSIINEQANPSLKNLRRISITAVTIALALYVVIGGAGYLTFGDHVVGNVITRYPQSAATTLGRIAIALLVILAFPLQCHPARASVNHILHFFETKTTDTTTVPVVDLNAPSTTTPVTAASPAGPHTDEFASLIPPTPTDELIEEGSPQQPTTVPLEGSRFLGITAAILVFSYLLAISVTSLARVLAVVGATGSTSISFILPGIFGYQLIGSEFKPGTAPFQVKLMNKLAFALACWGVCVLVTCLSATLFFGAKH
ncbi:LAMI_0D04830g1_1 [Lachancea mirantina]|uniref:LAMI_0D04830g1_1 n=1 Tax=Lachancea mirantina TaxID=1230905 RepID=A0A1G4JAV0_9SACH|nr:LAMI_0D04830g1_1 [Lachancea mirantina]